MIDPTKYIAQHAAKAGEIVRVVGQNADGTADLTHWAGVVARCDLGGGEEVDLVEIEGWLFAAALTSTGITVRKGYTEVEHDDVPQPGNVPIGFTAHVDRRGCDRVALFDGHIVPIGEYHLFLRTETGWAFKRKVADGESLFGWPTKEELDHGDSKEIGDLKPLYMITRFMTDEEAVARFGRPEEEQPSDPFPAKIGRINKLPRF